MATNSHISRRALLLGAAAVGASVAAPPIARLLPALPRTSVEVYTQGAIGLYRLVGCQPVEVWTAMEWAMAFEQRHDRHVALTHYDDGSHLSTVFLGLEHGWRSGEQPAVLFESMFFAADRDDWPVDTRRYTTWQAAEAGHAEMHAEILGLGYQEAATWQGEKESTGTTA